jgi:hypothetical protein
MSQMIHNFRFPDLLEHPVLLVFLVVANWPVYRYLVAVLFGGREGFGEAIRYWFIPDLYSYLKNRYIEDIWAELRLGVLLAIAAGCVVIEYMMVTSFLDWWYANVVCCGPER